MLIPSVLAQVRQDGKAEAGVRMSVIYFVALLLFTAFCVACGVNAQSSPPSQEKFSDCSGVFAFRNTGGWKKDVAVEIYDQDGRIWYRAEFNREGFDSGRDAGPNKIRPFVLVQGDYTPVFRCVSYSRNWYAVLVVEDEYNPVIKYMLRNDSLFEWKSWDQYYLGRWIRFDSKTNPLRTTIDSPDILEFPGQDTPTRMSSLDGDWMRLEWTDGIGEKRSGWIKWRDGKTKRVLVWFPYA